MLDFFEKDKKIYTEMYSKCYLDGQYVFYTKSLPKELIIIHENLL